MSGTLSESQLKSLSHAERRAARAEVLCRGTVIAVKDAGAAECQVLVATETITAARAETCMLQPVAGDTVLLSRNGSEPDYVVAVLARAGEQRRRWSPPADHALTLAATELEVSADRRLSLQAPQLTMAAARAELSLKATRFAGELLSGASDTLEWVGRRLQTVSQWSAHSTRSYARSVAGADVVEAEHVLRTARQTMVTRARHALTNAEEDIRMDAKRIHMG